MALTKKYTWYITDAASESGITRYGGLYGYDDIFDSEQEAVDGLEKFIGTDSKKIYNNWLLITVYTVSDIYES